MRKRALLNHRITAYDSAMHDRVIGKRSTTCERIDKSREHVEVRLQKLREIK
jgi:hypothetical protein